LHRNKRSGFDVHHKVRPGGAVGFADSKEDGDMDAYDETVSWTRA